MAATELRETRRWKRFAVGVALTLLLATVYMFFSAAQAQEPRFQDIFLWKVRPPQKVSPEVTVVVIDDLACEQIGKWPWAWRDLAGMIQSLTDLGARMVMLDITFGDEPGTVTPEKKAPGDLVIAEAQVPPLAKAIADSRHVVLAYAVALQDGLDDPLYKKMTALLTESPAMSRQDLATRLGVPESEVDSFRQAPLKRALELRMPELLAEEAESRRQLARCEEAARLATLRPWLELSDMRQALRAVARQRREEVFARLFPGIDFLVSEEGTRFREAADYYMSCRQLLDRGVVTYQGLGRPGEILRTERAAPPLIEFSRAARSMGYANVRPDADGIVRRVPLVIGYGERALPQLSVMAYMQSQGARTFDVRRLADDEVEIRGDNGLAVRAPVDRGGHLIVNWPEKQENRPDGFRRLTIRRLHEHSIVSDRKYEQAMIAAASIFGKTAARAEVRSRVDRALVAGADQKILDALWEELDAIDGPMAESLWKIETAALEETSRRMEKALAPGASREAFEALKQKLYPVDPGLFEGLFSVAGQGRIAGLTPEQYKLAMESFRTIRDHSDQQYNRQKLAELNRQLRGYVRDKICFVGMTATSLSELDLKATPLSGAYPGVYVHAAICDSLLRGRFISEAGPGLVLVTMLAVGLVVTLTAGWLPTLRSVLAALAVMGLYYALALGLFTERGLLMPLVRPWSIAVVVLLGVMTYRELTEGRNRRWITEVLKRHTSDNLVDELLKNPELLSLGGQKRELTVYFSDIVSFTSLTERLEAPQLVAFLQAYLEEMTDRLLEQGATLDKYEGDGIMAFIGAPVPMADHAARCLRASLEHLRALPVIDEKLHREGLLPEDWHLKVRIGVSTGPMTVGYVGSSRRREYTVIGDSVNVGGRVMSANRFFGTTALITGPTRDQATQLSAKTDGELFDAGQVRRDSRPTAAGRAAAAARDGGAAPAAGHGGAPTAAGRAAKASQEAAESAAAPHEHFLLRRIGPVRFLGKTEALEIYELLDHARPQSHAGLADYAAALADFEAGYLEEAQVKFTRVLEARPDDGPTLAYLTRLDTLRRDGLTGRPGPWDMTTK